MAYCRNCGSEVSENQDVCLKCGTNLRVTKQPPIVDNGGFAWGLLGFCVPVVGLILYLIWKDERPLTAKAVGVGALVSVIAGVALSVIYFIILVGMMSAFY